MNAKPERNRAEVDALKRLQTETAAELDAFPQRLNCISAMPHARQQLGSSAVYPVHLLYATLLAEDKHRDATLGELNIERKRLMNVAEREVLMPQLGSASASKKARTR